MLDESQRRAARVAAIACLVSVALVVAANFGIQERLVVRSDAAATARNIIANETLFRLNAVMFALYSAGTVVFLTALYVVLKPVSQGIALLAAAFRMVWAIVWLAASVNLLTAVRILNTPRYLEPFEVERLQGLARLAMATSSDVYYVGLLFYAMAATVCAWLWFRSRYIPRLLAAFGVAASLWCVATTIAYLIDPAFRTVVNLWWFDSPMAAFEIVTWLGVRPSLLLFPTIRRRALHG